jgi:hypothetical protein
MFRILDAFRLVLISIPATLGGSETYQVLSNIYIHFLSLANTVLALISWDPTSAANCKDCFNVVTLRFIIFDFGNQVIFDTGSSTLEITSKWSSRTVYRDSLIFLPGTLCGQACDNQIKFDPSKSSTFVDGGDVFNISFITGNGVDPVINNDYEMDLRNATDTVTVGGLMVANADLLLITNQTKELSIEPFSGVLGKSKAETRLQKVWTSSRNEYW